MAIKVRNERRRITSDVIPAETGITKSTLSRMRNVKEENVSVDLMNRLRHFIDCQPGEIFVYVGDKW